MIQLDKLKKEFKLNKKTLKFLIGISILGFIFGSIFIIIISNTDKILVKDYIKSFIKNIDKINYFDIFKNTIITNLLFIIIIWLLGMSVIGIPVNIFYYFLKSFIIGFTCVSFVLTYHLKGLIFSLIYIIPHNLVNLAVFTILVYYSFWFSILLIYSILKKKNINFKPFTIKYIKILLFSIIIILITSIYETFILPNIIKSLLFLIK